MSILQREVHRIPTSPLEVSHFVPAFFFVTIADAFRGSVVAQFDRRESLTREIFFGVIRKTHVGIPETNLPSLFIGPSAGVAPWR